MIVVYPFSTIDQDLALKNMQWINELGGCKGHECLVLFDKRCVPSLRIEIEKEMVKAFDGGGRIEAGAEINGWPQGANYFFRVASAWLQSRTEHYPCYLWMEPDAIPLRKGWLDMLEEEYKRSGRLFMGDRVQVGDIPLHMSGVGIYPNPLHAYAGEAYRAADEAWDMAAKDQIVPHAYFTKLIEHAWKHPKFTSNVELRTQIRPECVLFHSSKDGSLIDLLRGSGGGENVAEGARVNAPQEQHPAQPPFLRGEPYTHEQLTATKKADAVNCDIFIRTYPGDYEWLKYCLQSIDTFCSGFRKIWIVSSGPPPNWFSIRADHWAGQFPMEWKLENDKTPDGYLAQQITKLYADERSDADYILHVDSDVVFTRTCYPKDFMSNEGKVIWYYTPYDKIETPWQPITQKLMGVPVENEFMRRFPIMVPRWLYRHLRGFCFGMHDMSMTDYIKSQPHRSFSEFNALGAYGFFYHKKELEWVNTLQPVWGYMPEPVAKQYHSWSGLTPEIRAEITGFLGNGKLGSPVPTVPAGAARPAGGPSEVKAVSQNPVADNIAALLDYAKKNPNNMKYLRKQLRKHGLIAK